MNLLQSFTEFIKQENLFPKNAHLLLAVSGGVDSIVLCELCKQAGFSFSIAHCNFQLRDAESERDETFVRSLGEKYGVDILVKRFETKKISEERKLSIQVAARELRYGWFHDIISGERLKREEQINQADLIKPTGAMPGPALPVSGAKPAVSGYILTAHHADDNIETVLMNFFKGTGIAGIRGILPKQGLVVRPLLFARKKEILSFAALNDLAYVEDSSNLSEKFTRNYFRHRLIPEIEKVFPAVQENLERNSQRFREIEQLYHQAIDAHKKKILEIRNDEIHIPVFKLKKIVPLETVVYEIIKDFGFTAHQVKEVIDLMGSGSGKYIQSDQYRVIRHRDWLIVSPRKSDESQTIVIGKEVRKINFKDGSLELKELSLSNCQLSDSPFIAQLDSDEITFPLVLRKSRQGDYFYPLGMRKKKKLNRFLSDLKLPLTEKENTWVLEMNKKIVWVVGRRIDDRVKLTGTTSRVLQIGFNRDGKKHHKEP